MELVFLSSPVLLLTGEIFDFWAFTLKFERVMFDLICIGVMGALGQVSGLGSSRRGMGKRCEQVTLGGLK